MVRRTRPPVVPQRITLRTIRQWVKAGQKFPMLTCYDATTARWLWRGGIQVLLAGDSAAQMILGFDDTIHAPLDFMVAITAAVRRGAPEAFVMADMPFLSYHESDAQAVANAGRFMTEGQADAVKMEVDESFLSTVRHVTRAAIPVVAHIGWRPQSLHRTGTAVVAGRTRDKITQLVNLAQALQDAGAAMLLIEASTAEASQEIVAKVSIPVIGCGAGPACHGHVVILQDWLGLTDWHPAFAPAAVDGGRFIQEAAARWGKLVRSGSYLKKDHPYKLSE